ncbi:serine hydrolase domain-containing protein [Mariniluteicoccus flavus]
MSLLPHSSCTAEGVDGRCLDDLARAAHDFGVELHELVVVRHGKVVAQTHWSPWRPDVRQLAHSVSKTLVALAVGVCVGDGRLSVDDRFVDLFPEAVPFAPGVEKITVHHLLSMTTGHDEDTLFPMITGDTADWWKTFASLAPTHDPGMRHLYHNGASCVLAEVVARASGQPLVELLDARILGPMGIAGLRWKTDSLGRETGFSGAFLSAMDIAALGELILRDGAWRGERLVPEGWAATMAENHASTAHEANPHNAQGYGYQVWQGFEGFRLDGAGGQYGLVLPDRDAVVAVTAGHAPTQIVLDLLHRLVVPGLGSGQPTEPQALEGLQIPCTHGDRVTRGVAYAGEPRVIDRSVMRLPWRYPDVGDIELTVGDPWDDPVLTFTSDEGPTSVPCGNRMWRESLLQLGSAGSRRTKGARVRVAARAVEATSGPDHGATVVDIAFLETPFRLTLRLRDGDATMTWNSAIVHTDGLTGMGAAQNARGAGN